MLKTSLITLNLFALVVLKFIFGGDVTIKQKVPENIQPGENFTVEVQIEKGDREGFAKWQQKLPVGFIAEAKSTSGATFSFKNQEVKLIWMSLPDENEFSISYLIKTDPNLNGTFQLDGKFSFIEENERRDINSPSYSITIGTGDMNLASQEEKEEEEETVTEELAENLKMEPVVSEDSTMEVIQEIVPKTELGEKMDTLTETLSGVKEVISDKDSIIKTSTDMPKATGSSDLADGFSQVSDDKDIAVQREINYLGENKYLVSLRINKKNFNSFGKVEEYLPTDFIATEDQSQDGIFSFRNNLVKILWMNLPQVEDLAVSYLMESKNDLEEYPKVHGMFSYLNMEQSIQLELQASQFENHFFNESSDNEELAVIENDVTEEVQENNQITENQEETSENEKTEPEFIAPKDQELTSNNTAPVASNNAEEISQVPAPEVGVVFKVQIAAGKKEVQPSYFKKNHQIDERVNIEFHNSWYKYTVGAYNEYLKARNKRNQIWDANNKIDDAFVSAYNSGERISVQEALMVSNQKWLK